MEAARGVSESFQWMNRLFSIRSSGSCLSHSTTTPQVRRHLTNEERISAAAAVESEGINETAAWFPAGNYRVESDEQIMSKGWTETETEDPPRTLLFWYKNLKALILRVTGLRGDFHRDCKLLLFCQCKTCTSFLQQNPFYSAGLWSNKDP